jgi:hypothetical protein
MKRLFLVLALLFLTACAGSTVQVYSKIDPSEKTMTVPVGNSLILGEIKQRLINSGWKLIVDSGPRRTIGTLGEKTNLATGDTFLTRYRLIIRQSQFDTCLMTGVPAVSYDLSLVDNASGEEVMTQSGKDCTFLAADWFASAVSCTGDGYCASSSGIRCSRTVPCPAN